MKLRKSLLAAAALAFLTSPAAGLGRQRDPSPQEIIRTMAARYGALKSYQDSGVVEVQRTDAPPRRETDNFFKTHFTRPQKLRFEWFDYSSSFPERSIVWSDGQKTFTRPSYEPDKIETEEDLSMGLAGATGVSRGAAHTVPVLLLPEEVVGFSLVELARLSLKGQERFEGEDCYVVEGYHPNGEAWTLWISKRDFLLRKVRTPDPDGFKEEIRRDIIIDAEISEEVYRPKLVGGQVAAVISKAKEEDIRRLLELLAPRDRVNQQLAEMLDMLKAALPKVPDKVWREVVTEVRLDSDSILRVYVAIYDSHYSHEEVKQLLAFYETPLGRKAARNFLHIENEAVVRGVSIGREMFKLIQEKLRAKGYEVPAA